MNSHSVFLDESYLGKIRIKGPDHVDFLHRLLTNDIKALGASSSCPAAFLSSTGKMLMFMKVRRANNETFLFVEGNMRGKTKELLERFVIAEDLVLEDVAEEVKPVSREVETERIAAGILRYGIDMDEDTLLPETGLEEIVASETKGCYPGQEVVARIKTYGGLNRRIVQMSFEGMTRPQKGDEIQAEGKGIGRITSACINLASKRGTALGYLQKGFFEIKRRVLIQTGGRSIEAETNASGKGGS